MTAQRDASTTLEPATPPAVRLTRGRALAGLGLCAAVTVVVRLPLVGLPPSPDEGGYAEVAHRWAGGGHLYTDTWVDRPQGLLLLLRAIVTVSYTPFAVRCAAVAVAVVLTLAAGSAAWAVAGRRAAIAAAALTAVVAAGPFLEGYALNGELAGSAIGTVGVAGALWWWRTPDGDDRLLVPAAGFCAAAPLMKQSAVDALVVLLVVVLARADRRGRHLAVAAVGASLPLAGALVDALARGWSQWWYAVVTFQTTLAAGSSAADRALHIGRVLLAASPDLAGLLVIAVLGAVSATRTHGWPVVVWAAVAALGALAGPFSHEHYWVQAVAPLAVLAATYMVAAGSPVPPGRRRAVVALAVALVVPLLTQAVLAAQPAPRRYALVLHNDHQRRADPLIAAWLRQHTAPRESVYAFVASSDLYLLSNRRSDYPYLWLANVERVPGALHALQTWLDGDTGPRWVVVYQAPDVVDPSGVLASVLAQHYRLATTIDGYRVLTRTA